MDTFSPEFSAYWQSERELAGERHGGESVQTLSPSQQVALEARVRLEKLDPSLFPFGLAPSAPHPRPDQREILDRPDERAPLEQLLLRPEEPVELGGVIRPQPTPEHEPLRCRDARDRIDLEEAELADRVEHVPRAAVEQLRTNGDAPGLRG